jgi:tRNA1(Val) A37 N6-methylase TrmN6
VIIFAKASGISVHTIIPIWPKAGSPAHRVIVIGTVGKTRRLTMEAGIAIHNADGSYANTAAQILDGRHLRPSPHQSKVTSGD